MKKILVMLMAVIMLSAGAFAQTAAQLDKIRQASCKIRIHVKFPKKETTITVDGKKIIIKLPRPEWRVSGSGTITGRSLTNDPKLPKWIYWVTTAKHLFPGNIKEAEATAIWLYFFSHKGVAKINIKGASKFWISPTNLDVAFLGFYSDEVLPIIPVAKNLPENLFGVKYIAVGHPFGFAPFIREGYFATNYPTSIHSPDLIGTNAFAPGMSGGGVFMIQDGQLRLSAIVTLWVGAKDCPDRFGGATRVDSIIKLFKKYNMIKVLETE